jgi:predicted acylesterase/phospholipase RssA/ABC-type phosphate/phosphonate transport system substrate-binding protein
MNTKFPAARTTTQADAAPPARRAGARARGATRFARTLLGLCAALMLPPWPAAVAAPARAAGVKVGEIEEIKIGITEYQNLESAYEKFQQLFQELERQSRRPVKFKFAIGTYGEVIDWFNRKHIDVAVLSALPVTDLLQSTGDDEHKKIRAAMVGRIGPIPNCPEPGKERKSRCGAARERYLNEGEQEACSKTADFQYRVKAVARRDSGITSFEQVRQLMAGEEKPVRFLFVRPFSVSGYVLPSDFLDRLGVEWGDGDYEYTYQHHETLRRMLAPTDAEAKEDAGKKLVGFVIEDTYYCPPAGDAQPFVELTVPASDPLRQDIPHEVVLVNYNLLAERGEAGPKRYEELHRLLSDLFAGAAEVLKGRNWDTTDERVLSEAAEDPAGPASARKKLRLQIKSSEQVREEAAGGDWLRQYDMIREIFKTASLPRTLRSSSKFEELIKSLRTYVETTREMPRLALVLSGGGAKCSYQAGAVIEIENQLKGLRRDLCPRPGMGEPPEACRLKPELEDLDFDLVVGTSGGAINAFFTATKATADKGAQGKLRETWISFRQGDFFRPRLTFNIIFGLIFGLLQAVLISLAAWRFSLPEVNWARLGSGLVTLQAVEVFWASYVGAMSSTLALLVGAQTFAVLVAALCVRGLRNRLVARGLWRNWWRLAGWLMVGLSAVEFIVAYMQWPTRWPFGLDASHAVQHAWLLLSLVFLVSSPWPLVVGGLMILSGRRVVPHVDWEMMTRALAVLLLVVAGVVVLHTFLKQDSPSQPAGIEGAFAEEVPAVLHALDPAFPARAPEAAGWEGAPTELELLSEAIMSRPGMLKRDLIITVSKLPSDAPGADAAPAALDTEEGREQARRRAATNQLPDDLYFYYRLKGNEPPPGDKRFVSFSEPKNRRKLLDVVIGSGTIYPIFPYRELDELTAGGKALERIKIIDGGFIHNSPIQAAIDWGATHIVLVEASPLQKPYNPKNFLQNASVAFKYIFSQAQRMDTLSRGRAEIFELRPTSDCDKKKPGSDCADAPHPDMDTFDFSGPILETAFDAGLRDVGSPRPLFRRVPGQPIFRPFDLEAEAKSASSRTPWGRP